MRRTDGWTLAFHGLLYHSEHLYIYLHYKASQSMTIKQFIAKTKRPLTCMDKVATIVFHSKEVTLNHHMKSAY